MKLYNVINSQKENFSPIDIKNIRMYVCGPTVYDYAHIGNARPVIVFDLLYRLLKFKFGPNNVTYVRNITDLDDKINNRAIKEYPDLSPLESIKKITETTYAQYKNDILDLGTLIPDYTPKATEHINDMIILIQKLISNGFAYEANNHVLFHVPSMKEYGKLSNRTIEEMKAGSRIEIAPFKKSPYDFILWKPSSEKEPSWESPWGKGRPGWHIECSAMSWKYLGETFDIHGGGTDLIFPHHENEIAQSRSAFNTDFMAKYWLHNGFVTVNGKKMSKSLGNFLTIRSQLNKWNGDVIKTTILRNHYRQPFDWNDEILLKTKLMLDSFWEVTNNTVSDVPGIDFLESLEDDLATPTAFSILNQYAKSAKKGDIKAANYLVGSLSFLGLKRPEYKKQENIIEDNILKLHEDRKIARINNDFKEADRIRDIIKSQGYEIQDIKNIETGLIDSKLIKSNNF